MDKGSFTLSVIGPDPNDLDDLADTARSLRSDLTEASGITISDVPGGEPAAGTRSALVTEAIGSLAVLYYGGKIAKWALEDISRILHVWLTRNKGKRVVVKREGTEIDLTDLSRDEIMDVLSTLGNGGDDPARQQEVG